ncbi:Tomoregulin-2 [Liparis tanakae]|uniref:Tomoregulin-2 n=1 Tax=Liparis tanakae TaxID=230148 RepID=A0A4Z2IN93_9TELE|nr:Tomoregulin-2 [Liparis tanakae]
MTQGNDAKFHLFVFFSKVVLMGPRGEGSAEAGQKETSTCDICQFGAECDVDAEDVWFSEPTQLIRCGNEDRLPRVLFMSAAFRSALAAQRRATAVSVSAYKIRAELGPLPIPGL